LIDDSGKVIRAASSADPAFPDALLTPYSLVILPDLDRVVSTNSAMDDDDLFRGLTYQVWRLSDLKLLKTAYFDQGDNHYAQISPEEPRLGPDGSIYVQTLACGIERISAVNTDEPKSQLVYSFPGSFCGVPTIVGHFLIQSVPVIHGVIVLDIANAAHRNRARKTQRYLCAALDRLGRKNSARGRHRHRTSPLPAEVRPGNRRPLDGRSLP
jgi:hypothetical protein